MHLANLKSYLAADKRLCDLYADPDAWARKSILNVASSGKFSSDRHRRVHCRYLEGGTLSCALAERPMPKDGDAAAGISPLAGKPATKDMLIDVRKLESDYFARRPDISDPNQLVSFGTSGHRGSPFSATFTEAHILAITQAICDYRRSQAIDGPHYGERHACQTGWTGLIAQILIDLGESTAEGNFPTADETL